MNALQPYLDADEQDIEKLQESNKNKVLIITPDQQVGYYDLVLAMIFRIMSDYKRARKRSLEKSHTFNQKDKDGILSYVNKDNTDLKFWLDAASLTFDNLMELINNGEIKKLLPVGISIKGRKYYVYYRQKFVSFYTLQEAIMYRSHIIRANQQQILQ